MRVKIALTVTCPKCKEEISRTMYVSKHFKELNKSVDILLEVHQCPIDQVIEASK